ncbi:MAG TPA: hypothetical protein VFI33_12075, partial [Puia sp.]|nr:hypothetical protein [Puia sp.]
MQKTSFAQVNWSTTTATGNVLFSPRNNILGTTTNAPGGGFLDIRFFTNGVERMRLIGEPNTNLGFLGIGLTNPLYRLDVQDDINITNSNALGFGYHINGFTVLQIPGTQNTFVGRGTGASLSILSPGQNTFVGFQAGGSTTTGDRNTFVGEGAGYANTNGRFNTFLGADAGLNLASGNENTFVGEHSGWLQVAGNNNTYLGGHSGQGTPLSTGNNNTFTGAFCGPDVVNGNSNTYSGVRAGNSCQTGNQNCFYGELSARLTNTGSFNVFMGYLSDQYNRGGDLNTFIGYQAGVPNALAFHNLTNANGFGSNATARANNTMILGDNSVNVGIGLSNDIVSNGPQNKLEINADPASFSYTGVGGSGLRFRQLTENSSFISNNATNTVLSVDANGDVILVSGGGGFPFGGVCGNTNTMTNDFEIPMGTFNYVFSGQGNGVTDVGIGTTSGT